LWKSAQSSSDISGDVRDINTLLLLVSDVLGKTDGIVEHFCPQGIDSTGIEFSPEAVCVEQALTQLFDNQFLLLNVGDALLELCRDIGGHHNRTGRSSLFLRARELDQ
jgi:hypothetical protein